MYAALSFEKFEAQHQAYKVTETDSAHHTHTHLQTHTHTHTGAHTWIV